LFKTARPYNDKNHLFIYSFSIDFSRDKIQDMNVRVRIAPSPTGIPHIGNTRTVLYNYLFSRQNKGKFIVRIEDTDRKRLVPEALDKIIEILEFLGIDWDEGPKKGGPFKPYIQSKRLSIYQRYAEELIKKKKAYYCFCSLERLSKLREEQRQKRKLPRYDRHCLNLSSQEINKKLKAGEKPVVRLKIPKNQKISWRDLIQGKIEFETDNLDDQILLKSDGFPTYHLAVVVDDHLMKISHVFRGVEWISSTPKHILLYQAFGWKPPEFGHLPIILGSDKTKLSKRHGAKSALIYRDEGYLPEAINNFIVFLGWSYKDNSDLLTLKEMIKVFDISKVRRSNPIFDKEKLDWFNSQWIKKLNDKELLSKLKPYLKRPLKDDLLIKIIPLAKERMVRLTDINELIAPFFELPLLPDFSDSAIFMLKKIAKVLSQIKIWNKDNIYKSIKEFFAKNSFNKKDFYANLYIAIEGKPSGLPVFEFMEILGKEKSLKRLLIKKRQS
jgi:glutamyl-tRNA synthetase